MRKVIFYLIILLQVLFIAIIGWQYTLIDRFGETVKLTVHEKDYDYSGWTDNKGNRHISYDISKIPKERWNVPTEDFQYNEPVFVLLKQHRDGHYVVKKASTHKLKPKDDQIVYRAKYMYTSRGYIEVNYGIEMIERRMYKSINEQKPYSVFIKVAPWGQKKIIKLQNED